MSAKVRIKAGLVEFEYEGETELSISDIKDLFSHIETLFTVPILASGGAIVAEDGTGNEGSEVPPPTKGANKLHVNSVAAKLNAKTATDVAMAAAAYLQLMAEKDTFSRQELLATMKGATKFYNANMAGNLTKTLKVLVGTKFNQVGTDQYSLTSPEHEKLEAAFA
ncbi:hypothetical protein [Mesorhizobium muleiense]|uniref:Uncharacterized protein n=1 Tax=Mesorhizobium muleiense TaxID=1004279 RepID=A0A1G8X4U2_9HYPH|nr:hypothetical protein [Mesorhizobium muleiense]MCF6097991.1 hypothetical protein [Mesorhizobium muleiense]SDJ85632.1 hypothetical protein SAMN05428953_109172 [Mesorhizobium muleiense]